MVNTARAVRVARAALGITQDELARRIGAHESSVSRFEGGSRKPTVDRMEAVARALDIPLPILMSLGQDEEDGSFTDNGPKFLRWLSSIGKQVPKQEGAD